MEKHLVGMVAAKAIIPTNDDITRFLLAKLKEDPTPDAMDQSLQEDILNDIPESISEM